MFYVVAVGCPSALINKNFLCCFVHDDVNNIFVVMEHAQ